MHKTVDCAARIEKNVTANMKAEGFHVSAATKRDCQAIASGRQSAQTLVKARINAAKTK